MSSPQWPTAALGAYLKAQRGLVEALRRGEPSERKAQTALSSSIRSKVLVYTCTVPASNASRI